MRATRRGKQRRLARTISSMGSKPGQGVSRPQYRNSNTPCMQAVLVFGMGTWKTIRSRGNKKKDVCWLVCWLDCWQDYRKTTGQIFTKHGWRMGFGPEETPLTFYADSDKRTDPGIFFSDFFLTWHDKREM